MELERTRLDHTEKSVGERRRVRRWGTAFNIICCASLSGVLLFALFLALVRNQYFLTAGFVMLLGTAAIVAGTLFAWNYETAQRMLRLMRNMREAEQARDAAAQAMEEKTRLLATMSHEIRTPLNGVIGMLNLLMHTELTPEQKNYANTAQSSGRTLLSIIDEILDTSKAEAKTAMEQHVNVLDLVESVTELLAPRAHGKGIELSARVSTTVPELLLVDDLKLRQILFNIAGNAIKFTHQGGVRIELSAAGRTLTIVIADTGIGMTEDEQARLFTAFEQANETISKSYGGTGLGLVITKRLVEQLNGEIALESRKGKGTSFVIKLPDVLAQPAQPPTAKPLEGRRFALALKDGVNAEHLRDSLMELGAQFRSIDLKDLKGFLAAPATDTVVIADSSVAASLRLWAKSIKKTARNHHAVWVMLTAEERQTHPDLMNGVFAGYLLKPLRRSTLLGQLTAQDDTLVTNAVTNLRALTRHKGASKPLRILVAEDNPVNMLLVTTMLAKAGHTVEETYNGMDALKRLLEPNGFDLAIVDVNMPGLSGLELARRLRQHETDWGAESHMPLLALTGNAQPRDRDACLKAGMSAHLAKPFDQHDLLEKIAKIVRQQAA